jgi:hypothetical protein
MKTLKLLLSALVLAALSAGASTTINYTISGTTGTDWTGTFVVSDASVAINSDDSLTITALYSSTTYNMSADYFGSNGEGWIVWTGAGASMFSFYSSDLYSAISGDGTWADLDGKTYNLNPNTALSFSVSGSGLFSFAGATAGASTIAFDFASVPEPSTYAALAGIAALGIATIARRKKKA